MRKNSFGLKGGKEGERRRKNAAKVSCGSEVVVSVRVREPEKKEFRHV